MAPRAFAALPDRDQRAGDYHGAFRPEAECFGALHGCAPVEIDISRALPQRCAQLYAALRAAGQAGPLGLVALLCHGWHDGLQLGPRRTQAPDLAAAIASAAAPGAVVVLYACSTADAEGDAAAGTAGGFAELLSQCLSRCVLQDGSPGDSLSVVAHDRAGHVTRNPYARRIGAAGDAWIVAPGSEQWPAWDAALHDRRCNLRLRYPLMSSTDIEDELRRRS